MSKNFKVKNGLEVTTNVTASGDISSSENILASNFGVGTTNPSQAIEVNVQEDYLMRLTSTDNKAVMTIRDDNTTGFISSENEYLSLGGNPGVNAGNLNIATLLRVFLLSL